MLRQGSVVGVLAIGMTFVIATAGIDLSVGSMVAASPAVAVRPAASDSGSVAFVLGALAFGIVLGAINGPPIAYGKVVPFIATLAMLLIARGLALWMSDKTPISLFDLEVRALVRDGEVLEHPVVADRLPGRRRDRLGAARTAPRTAATSSPSAATPRRRGSPA